MLENLREMVVKFEPTIQTILKSMMIKSVIGESWNEQVTRGVVHNQESQAHRISTKETRQPTREPLGPLGISRDA